MPGSCMEASPANVTSGRLQGNQSENLASPKVCQIAVLHGRRLLHSQRLRDPPHAPAIVTNDGKQPVVASFGRRSEVILGVIG